MSDSHKPYPTTPPPAPATPQPALNPYAPPPVNPYAPPSAKVTDSYSNLGSGSDEELRHELLQHERSIQSIGSLYLLGVFIWSMAMVAMVVGIFAGSEQSLGESLSGGLVAGVLALLFFWIGSGLRQLNPRVRLGATILAVIGLVGFPFGTLINGYILYLLHSEKGKRILTSEYQAVVARTPHIKHKMSMLMKFLLFMLVASVLFVAVSLIVPLI